MSDAALRLSELKRKLLLSRKASPEPLVPPPVQPLPNPAPRPLTRASAPLEPIKDSVADKEGVSAEVVPTKKPPLTLRSLMSSRNKLSGSRLKEAPAHRALLAESKSSLIRSKMIYLSKQPAEEEVPEPVAINPFAVLFPLSSAASSPEDQFISEKRAWLKRTVEELGIEVNEKNKRKAMRVDQFIALHRKFLTLSG